MSELGDLPAGTWTQIDTVLARFPRLRWVKLYGSRAIGRQRRGSDIDLAFSSADDCSGALAGAFDELPIPYKVDVTHWESLSHEGLRRHIATVGIPVPIGLAEDPEDGAVQLRNG
jgi:predicted nucleotidyltransferase